MSVFAPSKAIGQTLNCKYGEWTNPNTNSVECFGGNGEHINIIKRRKTKHYHPRLTALLQAYEDNYKSVMSLASNCVDLIQKDPSYEDFCIQNIASAILSYKDSCDRLYASEFPGWGVAQDRCYDYLEKIVGDIN